MVKMKGSKRTGSVKPSNRNDKFDNGEDNGEDNEDIVTKKWYEGFSDDSVDFKALPTSEVSQLRSEAKVVLENDVIHHMNKCSKGPNQSDNQWLQTMMSKGTFQDRIAASVVLVQNSPIYSLNIIRNLVNLVKTGKNECIKAMEVLAELFISDLLVPDRKLKLFEKRPLSLLDKLSEGHLIKRKFYLTMWYFEDQLKNEYNNFVLAIQIVGQDTVASNREKSITVMQKMLAANPEQEILLLSSLVNKMGDPVPKVASKAVTCLINLLNEHPNMKTVVMEEIEKLLFRANISSRAQYYGICFLTQYVLTKDDEELACRLIQLYFSFFKGCIKTGEIDSRMMSGLLVGVKRAFPFANKDELKIKDYIETMYEIVHIAQFNVGLHALYLLFHVSDYDSGISDRFYSALYQKIIDPRLGESVHHASFISLVFRAMSKDIQYSRVKIFIKRLLQICHYVPVGLACGILIMISHLLNKNKDLQSVVLVATDFKEEDEKSDEEHYEDIKVEEEEENLVYTSGSKCSEVKNVLLGEELSNSTSHKRRSVAATWYHAANMKEISGKHVSKLHRMYSRNPLFAGVDLCIYTELVTLSTHFHPTISLFANHLLQGKRIVYEGDPLYDFTLAQFLERWVFKNPRKLDDESISSKHSRKLPNLHSGVKTLAVNSKEYLNTAESNIPVEELFIYRFLKQQQAEGKGPKEENADDSDVSSVASDEFEGMMDQLMGGKEEIDFSEGISQLPKETGKKNKRKKGQSSDSSSSEEGESDEESDDSDADDKAGSESDIDINEDNDAGDEGLDSDLDYEKIKEEFSDLDELDDDNDDEAITFNDDGEDDFSFTMSDVERDEDEHKEKKKSKRPTFKDKKKKKGIDSVFAPAEEFAQILEDTGDQMAKFGNIANLSNKDNAGVKQLKWEMARNQWIRGRQHGKRKSGKQMKTTSKKFKRW